MQRSIQCDLNRPCVSSSSLYVCDMCHSVMKSSVSFGAGASSKYLIMPSCDA